MTLITLREIIDLVIVTLVLGYLFMRYVPKQRMWSFEQHNAFDWSRFRFALTIAAPAVILHELGHKFIALAFGLSATFKAWFFGLFLGFLFQLFNSPIMLLAPGYVEISPAPALVTAAVAFAGPLVNLLMFLIARYQLISQKRRSPRKVLGWYLTKQINITLFIFNMLPIPPLDGSKVFFNVISALF